MLPPAGWSTQAPRTQPATPATPPSPAAFHGFTLRNADLISVAVTMGTVAPVGIRVNDIIPQIFYSKPADGMP